MAAGPGSRWATAGTPTSPPCRTVTSSGIAPRKSRSCSCAKRSPPPRPKISVTSPQCGQTKSAHVLDDPDDRHVHPLEHRERLVDVEQGDFLGRRDEDGPGDRHGLGERQLGVRGPGRQVDDEVVELAPLDVAQELLDRAADERAAPDDGLALGHEELDRDRLHAVPLEGHDLVRPALAGLSLEPEHHRDVGAGDVGVEESDGRARPGEGHREVDADRALADTALAGRNGDDVLDARDQLLRVSAASARRTIAPQVMATASTPIGSSAACTRDSISSLSGQAGVVSSMVKATAAPSMVEVLDHVAGDEVTAEFGFLDLAEGGTGRRFR